MLSAPFIIAESELLMAIPSFVASKIKQAADVTSFRLPFPAPKFTVKIYSHKRSGKREPTEWIKSMMAKTITQQAYRFED